MQQREELRNDALDAVGNINLIAIELNLVLLKVEVALNLREVEHSGEVERIVYVKVNPEQRIVGHRVELVVEVDVVLVLEFAWLLCPDWSCIVYHVVLGCFNLFAVLPFGLLAECNRDGEELAVFVQKFLNLVLLEELLAVVVNVENDIRTALALVCLFEGEFRRAVAAPFYSLAAFFPALCYDFYLLADHE